MMKGNKFVSGDKMGAYGIMLIVESWWIGLEGSKARTSRGQCG